MSGRRAYHLVSEFSVWSPVLSHVRMLTVRCPLSMFAVIAFLPLMMLSDASSAEAALPTTYLDVDVLTTPRGDLVTATIDLLRYGTAAPALL